MKKGLTKKELNVYKENLLNLKDDIYSQMREISEDTLMKSQKELSGDMSGYSLHIADVATDNYEREFNLGIVSGERNTLLEIDEALKRIEDRTYGVCRMCNKNITKSRLKAIPYAKYCKKCAEEAESKKKYE